MCIFVDVEASNIKIGEIYVDDEVIWRNVNIAATMEKAM